MNRLVCSRLYVPLIPEQGANTCNGEFPHVSEERTAVASRVNVDAEVVGKKGMNQLHGKVGGNQAIRAVGRGHS
jgi:hypothetical protein